MAATWDTIDRYVVISADTHAGADLYDYKPYLPVCLHDEFDAWATDVPRHASAVDDLISATARMSGDHELRIADMDADGVAAELLLPQTVPPFSRLLPTPPSACPGLATSSKSVGPVCRPTTAGRSTSVRWPRPGAAG